MDDHQRLSQEVKKEAWWEKWLQHTLVAMLLVGLIGYFTNDYFSFKGMVLENYSAILNDIEDLIYNDEPTKILCKKYAPQINQNESCAICNSLEQYTKYQFGLKEYQMLMDMAVKYADINKRMRMLGGFFKQGTYNQVRHLTCWQNQFMSSGNGLCHSSVLLSDSELDDWKDYLTIQITKDKRENEGLFYSLWQYVLYKFTAKIDVIYPLPHCDLYKTSAISLHKK